MFLEPLTKEEDITPGDIIALDSTAIDAYEKKKSKSKLDNVNATWGAKFDSFRNKLTWFGCKIHLAVDGKSELPVAKEYLTANSLHVGGIDKVKTHVFFNAIVLLASALALKRHKGAGTDTKSA